MATLVLLRHGESTYNEQNTFTGWRDCPLSAKGESEARAGGRLMAEAGLSFDICHTSVLTRSTETAHLALTELDQVWLPVQRNWRLNERHYGALQGLNKKETAEQYGNDQTHVWRRSYDVPPPPVDLDSPDHPVNDPRYRLIPPDALPASECLKDVLERVLPYWYDAIVPQLQAGLLVLVVAHGNSLRALVKHLEGITDEEIPELNIPTGVPRRYELDAAMRPTEAAYLGNPDEIAARAAAVAAQAGTSAPSAG